MTLTIVMQMDNAAFTNGRASVEVKRILAHAAERLDFDASNYLILRDHNGNAAGRAEVSK